jgi:hypothetical protein
LWITQFWSKIIGLWGSEFVHRRMRSMIKIDCALKHSSGQGNWLWISQICRKSQGGRAESSQRWSDVDRILQQNTTLDAFRQPIWSRHNEAKSVRWEFQIELYCIDPAHNRDRSAQGEGQDPGIGWVRVNEAIGTSSGLAGGPGQCDRTPKGFGCNGESLTCANAVADPDLEIADSGKWEMLGIGGCLGEPK